MYWSRLGCEVVGSSWQRASFSYSAGGSISTLLRYCSPGPNAITSGMTVTPSSRAWSGVKSQTELVNTLTMEYTSAHFIIYIPYFIY